MSFPNSNFEGTFSTYVFGKSFWHYRELKIDCWTSRHILREKILNSFVSVEVRILVENCIIYEVLILPRPLLQTWRLETNSLWLNTRLRVNKIFTNSHYVIEIKVNLCLLWTHPVMRSIILHTRRPNCQYKVRYALGFYVSADFLFSLLSSWKALFSHSSISPTEVYSKEFQLIGGQ